MPLIAFLAWTPVASAWSWPVHGPVLQPFSYDESHPYAAGQHRGIDIGAAAAGESVVAPAAGTVSFAGTVPTSGKSVTIDTADGYSVTLTHLGSILVVKGAAVAEHDAVGTIGPSGTPDVDGPYVHLGIRVAADPNGYLDPLGFLPPAADGADAEGGSTAAQPSSGGSSSAAPGSAPSAGTGSSAAPPATQPASSEPASPPLSQPRGSTVSHAGGRRSSHARERAQRPRAEARSPRSPRRPAVRPEATIVRDVRSAAPAPRRRAGEPTSSSRRPGVETAAPVEPAGLGAGHEIRWGAPVERLLPSETQRPTASLPLVLNGAAALVALAAAFAAARSRRRRRTCTSPIAEAQVLHLPQRAQKRYPASRAA